MKTKRTTIMDRPTGVEWQDRTLIPFLNEHLPEEESVVFADNLDAQIQPAYLENQKNKGRALGWSLLKDGTFWSQPIGLGPGREIERDVDYCQNEWLDEVEENLDKWEGSMTASDRRICMTWWAGDGYARACERLCFDRYFAKAGCKITVNGEGDGEIQPEGLQEFIFDRPNIPAVIVQTPEQARVPAATHAEMHQAVMEQELQEEAKERSDEGSDDECEDEEQKWFVPEGYTLMKDALPDEQFNCSVVGWHVMFKWSGVGWCHGWVLKYYAKHRLGYNFEVKYEDGDRRDHILTPKSYGHGDQVPLRTCEPLW
ncbi:hypothetical protein CYMTET_13400 [Cymbomonas tetramitiformis]|uniref:Uncharacterized protein n=1 Tax=Cymbomonas tetramitiformis TaxID=36881 RepID=A0AAE0GII3_9CHLO|nr:hypothetical protein CYMTET_13400 [Cymbomonas tetramitiformis]